MKWGLLEGCGRLMLSPTLFEICWPISNSLSTIESKV